MNTITTLGTVDDVLAAAPDEVRPLCLALRALIAELHPGATEVPRKGERTVAYGFGEKKMSEAYAYVIPQLIGAPQLLETTAAFERSAYKIQFLSVALVAFIAGIGFEAIFRRMQQEAENVPIGAPR
jgi:ABC-type thiamin/hydroxymethylpyrimidine transport system permease subunit